MEEWLKFVTEQVGEWLRFAEGKNAGLLVFDSAVAAVCSQVMLAAAEGSIHLPWPMLYYLGYAMICLISAILLCLISFLPRLGLFSRSQPHKGGRAPNLFYYEDIAGYAPSNYVLTFAVQAGFDTKESNAVIEQLAEHLITNSCIASRKYRLFAWATWITVFAIATPIGGLILLIFSKKL